MKFKRTMVYKTIHSGLSLSKILIIFLNITHIHTSNYSISGNPIWDKLLKSCRNSSSGYMCVQNNFFNYVDKVLLNTEFYVSDSFYFKNKINTTTSHFKVPESNQSPFYSDKINDSESLEFNSFIDELESVEQELDKDEKTGDAKADDMRNRRKNVNAHRESEEDERTHVHKVYNENNENLEQIDDDIVHIIDHKQALPSNEVSNDWNSVEYATPKENGNENAWNINLDNVVNVKPEWNPTNGHMPTPEDDVTDEISQNSWIPKSTVNAVEPTRKLSSQVKQGRSLDLNKTSRSQNELKVGNSEKIKSGIDQINAEVLKTSTEIIKTSGNGSESPSDDSKPGTFLTKDETEENMIPDSEHMPDAPYKTIYDVSAMFYEKSVNYFMNHDLVFFLPQFMFGGAQITLSPKGIEADGGINLRLNINSLMKPQNPNGQSRLFFKHMRHLPEEMWTGLKKMQKMLSCAVIPGLLEPRPWRSIGEAPMPWDQETQRFPPNYFTLKKA